jgi:hypothetical protein
MMSTQASDQALESVSIFCRGTDFSLVAKSLDSNDRIVRLENGPEDDGVEAICNGHAIRLSALRWAGPGEALAKTLLGALAYVRRIATTHDAQRQQLLNALSECRLLIGVTGTPGCLSDPECRTFIRTVAFETGGVLFDGADFFSADGLLLLSHDGRSETN